MNVKNLIFMEAHDYYFDHFCRSGDNSLIILVFSHIPNFVQEKILQKNKLI